MSVDCLTYYYPSQREIDISSLVKTAVVDLKPGGLLAVRDVVVPGSHLRGKKADLQRQAGDYVNIFLQLSGWLPAWSQNQWHTTLEESGFLVTFVRVTAVNYSFHKWASHLTFRERLHLRVLLTQAPAPVLDYLTPLFAGDRIAFQLQELWIVSSRQ